MFALLFLVGQAGAQGTAQQQFAMADWFTRPLAPGVVWRYYQFDNLFNSKQSISYIEADLNVPGVRLELLRENGLQQTSDQIQAQFPQAAAGVNGTFFSYKSADNRTFVRINGTELPTAQPWSGSWGTNAGLVFDRASGYTNVIVRPGAKVDAWGDANYSDVMVNGPMVLKNGSITSNRFPSGSHCNRNPRTVVGIKPGKKLMLMVADGRFANEAAGLTCEEMGLVMQALGCSNATSLDGGGSSAMYGRGEPHDGVINYPSSNGGYDHDDGDQRSVANGIAVLGNPRVPLPYDARLESVTYTNTIKSGQRNFVTLKYKNIGSQTWTSDKVTVTTSRPFGKVGRYYDPGFWPNQSTAWRLPVGTTVPPNAIVTLSFGVIGPLVTSARSIGEHFQLTVNGTQRFGPADNEVEVLMTVSPPPSDVTEWPGYSLKEKR